MPFLAKKVTRSLTWGLREIRKYCISLNTSPRTPYISIEFSSPDEVYRKLLEALEVADIVVSTGGVSMGERDFLKQVLVTDVKAEIHFGSVLMKPG